MSDAFNRSFFDGVSPFEEKQIHLEKTARNKFFFSLYRLVLVRWGECAEEHNKLLEAISGIEEDESKSSFRKNVLRGTYNLRINNLYYWAELFLYIGSRDDYVFNLFQDISPFKNGKIKCGSLGNCDLTEDQLELKQLWSPKPDMGHSEFTKVVFVVSGDTLLHFYSFK